MNDAAPEAKLPCLEQQPHVCSRLAHALSRCITTESVAGPVSKALRLLFPASVHMSIELPVLPKVLLSTQNLLVEGQCALMFYSLSNTLAGHVYSMRCATSATAQITRKDAQLLDVQFLGQLKAHHQLSLPVVLDEQEMVMQGIANAKDPVSYVQQAYMSLAETAPVMGTVTLGMTAPLSDRELSNLCILMASMSKHLATDWKTFFDIVDPSHVIAPAKTAPPPAPQLLPHADDASMDEYEYATESDDDETTSTQSDAAFDGTTSADATSRPTPEPRDSLQHSGSKRTCHDEATRVVRSRRNEHDDDDHDVCGGRDARRTHSGTGSQGSTAFGSATTSRGGTSSAAAPAGSASRGGGTRMCAADPPSLTLADHKLAKPPTTEQAWSLALGIPNADHEFACFHAQQFVGNDRLLCVLSMCILIVHVAMRGVPTVLLADQWKFLELVVVVGAGLLSLSSGTWYTRHREAVLLFRWVITILVGTAATTQRLASAGGSAMVIVAANTYLLCASAAPMRFSTLAPLLLINMLAMASTIPTVCPAVQVDSTVTHTLLKQMCVMHATIPTLVVNCAVRVAASFTGMVVLPACVMTYITETCTQKAYRHYLALEAARLGA